MGCDNKVCNPVQKFSTDTNKIDPPLPMLQQGFVHRGERTPAAAGVRAAVREPLRTQGFAHQAVREPQQLP